MSDDIAIFFTPISFGGGEQQVALQLKYLKKVFGYNIKVVNLAYSKRFEIALEQIGINFLTITDKSLGFSPSKKDYLHHLYQHVIPSIFRYRCELKRTMDSEIVWCHGFESAVVGYLLSKLCRCSQKLFFTRHSIPNIYQSKIKKIVNYQILNNFQKIISVSTNVNQCLLKGYPKLANKLIVIPNGIEYSKFDLNVNKNELRKKLGLQQHLIYGIYVARFMPSKNHLFLLKLLKVIQNELFKLIFVGDGSCLNYIKIEAKKMDLEDRVIFCGFIENKKIPLFFNAADLCLFPSKQEGFGISILEAMAAGLPVILFKEIYMEELNDAVLVAENESDFIDQCYKLLDDTCRNQYGYRAKELAKQFDIMNIVERYHKLFKRI